MFVIHLKYIKPIKEIEELLTDHVRFLDKFYSTGNFICSGKNNSRIGTVIICFAKNKTEVDGIIQEDPFYIHNLAEYEVISGLQCSQAVLATLGEQLGFDRKQALKLASGFGGGIASQGDLCGAVSGAIMAIGLKHGYDEGPNVKSRDKVYSLVQKLIQGIKSKHGCYTCKCIIGLDLKKPDENKLAYEQDIFSKICPHVIKDVVEIVEEIW